VTERPGWWVSSTAGGSGVITREQLEELFVKMRDEPLPAPCGSEARPHMLTPRGWRKVQDGGQAWCFNCGAPVPR
jgi:hypothetical protein